MTIIEYVNNFIFIRWFEEGKKKKSTSNPSVLQYVNNCFYAFCLFFRLKKRQEKTQTSMLLQGVTLPDTVSLAVDPLPLPRQRPSEPLRHEAPMEFDEPPNREGQTAVRPRKKRRMEDTPSSSSSTMPFPPTMMPPPFPPIPSRPTTGAWPGMQPGQFSWYGPQPWPVSSPHLQEEQEALSPSSQMPQSRQRSWRREKALKEDEERVARGEAPKKRYSKRKEWYTCSQCQEPKTKDTGHTQYKGKWYCPASGQSLDEWRSSLKK